MIVDLADEYSLDDRTMKSAISGKNWKHVDTPDEVEKRIRERLKRAHTADGEYNPQSKLTPEQVVTIRRRYRSGDALTTELADEYGMCRDQISKIINGKSWPNADGPIKGEDYEGRR